MTWWKKPKTYSGLDRHAIRKPESEMAIDVILNMASNTVIVPIVSDIRSASPITRISF